MAASSPPPQPSKPSNRKSKGKRKRNLNDPEPDRFDSLPWNRSLPEDDTFSAFVGSHELEGGSSIQSFLSLYVFSVNFNAFHDLMTDSKLACLHYSWKKTFFVHWILKSTVLGCLSIFYMLIVTLLQTTSDQEHCWASTISVLKKISFIIAYNILTSIYLMISFSRSDTLYVWGCFYFIFILIEK